MPSSPHDALFRRAFEQPAHAAGLVRGIVDPGLAQRIAWNTMRTEPGSFVDADLAMQYTDLLYSVALRGGGSAFVYVLLEHQSTGDGDMPLRMLIYMARIWARYRREHPQKLPAIVPIVLTHAPAGWTAPVRFWELVEPYPGGVPGLADAVPAFSLLVEDLTRWSDDELRTRALQAFPKLALWLLRDGREGGRLVRHLESWLQTFLEALRAPGGAQAVALLLRYAAQVLDRERFTGFRVKLQKVPELEAQMATMAEEWLAEGQTVGREQGRAEGRKEGLRLGTVQLLLTQLAAKFGELSPEHRAQVEAATDDRLETFALRMLTAERVGDVLG